MLKGILFDMDGILVNSEVYYMEESYRLLSSLGYKGTKEEIYRVIGTTMEMTYEIFAEMLGYRYTKDEIGVLNEKHFTDYPLIYKDYVFEDVVETLRIFKSMGLKMAICSSSSLIAIKECISSLAIEDCFELIVSGENFTHSKPNPEIYLYALNHLGLRNDEVIIYEDSYHGIKAGKNAKVYTVAKKDQLFGIDQSQADAYVMSISELKDLVKKRMEG